MDHHLLHPILKDPLPLTSSCPSIIHPFSASASSPPAPSEFVFVNLSSSYFVSPKSICLSALCNSISSCLHIVALLLTCLRWTSSHCLHVFFVTHRMHSDKHMYTFCWPLLWNLSYFPPCFSMSRYEKRSFVTHVSHSPASAVASSSS